MATITINGSFAKSSAIANADEIGAAFAEHKQELTWLAEFLTNDELMASACVADAGDLSKRNKEDEICQECVRTWPRGATIHSALDLKRTRIAELSLAYECEDQIGRQHGPLSSDIIEVVVSESDVIRRRLDSLCRFVLVLCGIERHSVRDVACLLGISKHAVEASYSRALGFLEVMYCQEVLESYEFPAA